jgi:hypothetical protein
LKIAGKGYKVLGNLTNSFWKQGSSVRLLLIAVSVPSDMASMSSVYLNSKSALQLPLEAIQQFISEQFSKLYKTMNVDLWKVYDLLKIISTPDVDKYRGPVKFDFRLVYKWISEFSLLRIQ